MRIKDICKKINNKKIDKKIPVLDINTSLYDISEEFLSRDILYFSNNSEIIGYLRTDLIRYLQSINLFQFKEDILENISEGIIVTDADGKISYVNHQYSKILGVKPSSIIGKNIKVIEKDATIIQVLKTGKIIKNNNNYVKSLGKFLDVRIYPIYKDNRLAGAYSIFSDVTEITQLNNEISRVSKMAQDYNRQLYAEKKMKELNIIGKSPNYINVILKAVNVARTDASVLVLGENGSGKDVLCQLVHKNSLRKDKSFVSVNCSAIPENLIESELFGYEGGSFTGSQKGGKLGKFELADKGTIFLDEIADMSLTMQAKILRVLETGEIEKIGSQKKIKVDVRVISATNKNLERMIEQGLFREDLYYRLSVIVLELPPLRKRNHDSILFLNYFLTYYNEKYKKNLIFSNRALNKIIAYDWPGNIRELKNCIEHAVILCNDKKIGIEHLPKKIQNEDLTSKVGTLEEIVNDAEKNAIKECYDNFCGDVEKVAEKLSVSKRTLYRKLSKYKINKNQ